MKATRIICPRSLPPLNKVGLTCFRDLVFYICRLISRNYFLYHCICFIYLSVLFTIFVILSCASPQPGQTRFLKTVTRWSNFLCLLSVSHKWIWNYNYFTDVYIRSNTIIYGQYIVSVHFNRKTMYSVTFLTSLLVFGCFLVTVWNVV